MFWLKWMTQPRDSILQIASRTQTCALSQAFNLFFGVGKRKPECNLYAVYDAVVSTREFEHVNCTSQRLLIRLYGKVERVPAYVDDSRELKICDAGQPWMGVPTDARISAARLTKPARLLRIQIGPPRI